MESSVKEQSRKLYHRQRLTRAEAILKGPEKSIPVQGPSFRKAKSSTKNKQLPALKKSSNVELTSNTISKKKRKVIDAVQDTDITTDLLPGDLADVWETSEPEAPSGGGDERKTSLAVSKSKEGSKKRMKTIDVPAVIIDPAGCSINPDRELHQDAIAEAVATEMRKVYDRDLKPTAPLLQVDYAIEQDELELLLGDSQPLPEAAENGSEDQGLRSKDYSSKINRKTKRDRAKEIRRREEEAKLAEQRRHKAQRRDLSELKRLVSEVDSMLTDQELRRERRKADLEEKAASNPPRLSKHRFEPLPLQVLTTEEVEAAGGSLRQIKPTPMLIKDRFKSLQRRGVIEPRQPVKKKKGKRIQYVHSQRGDEAARRQAELGRTNRAK